MILLIDSGFLPWGAKMHHKWLGSWLAKRRLPQDVVAFLLANDCWKLFSSQMIAGRQTIGKKCALKTANELFTGDNAMQSAATDLTDFKVQKSWSAWLMKNWPLWEHPTPCGKRCALKKAYELFTGDNAMQSAATDLTDFKVPKSWSAWRMKNRPLWEHPTPSLHWKWSYESTMGPGTKAEPTQWLLLAVGVSSLLRRNSFIDGLGRQIRLGHQLPLLFGQAKSLTVRACCWSLCTKLFERYIIINSAKCALCSFYILSFLSQSGSVKYSHYIKTHGKP